MKDAALILNPIYKDQGVQTTINYDQRRGQFVALDTLGLLSISTANLSIHSEPTTVGLALIITYHCRDRTSVPYQW